MMSAEYQTLQGWDELNWTRALGVVYSSSLSIHGVNLRVPDVPIISSLSVDLVSCFLRTCAVVHVFCNSHW